MYSSYMPHLLFDTAPFVSFKTHRWEINRFVATFPLTTLVDEEMPFHLVNQTLLDGQTPKKRSP
jgi:hypothetical protein